MAATAIENDLISDNYFLVNPHKVLGKASKRKRGDRGVDEYEDIVTNDLDSAIKEMVRLSNIQLPKPNPFSAESRFITGGRDIVKPVTVTVTERERERERERLRLLSLSLEIDLQLSYIELE